MGKTSLEKSDEILDNICHMFWKKCMFIFIKHLIGTNLACFSFFECNFYIKAKWKTVKHFEAAYRLGAITLIWIVLGGRCPGVYFPGDQLFKKEIFQVQLSVGNFPRWDLSGGNCLGGNYPTRELSWGKCPGGNCPRW